MFVFPDLLYPWKNPATKTERYGGCSCCGGRGGHSNGSVHATDVRSVPVVREPFDPGFAARSEDQSLLLEDKASSNDVVVKKNEETVRRTRRPQLRKLMVEEEREATTSSCSSSEADELDGLKQGTYCVWKPKNGVVSGSESERRNKCGSTGSSRRWKLRDILSRSRSVGKEGLLFAPSIKKGGGSKRTGKEETAVPAAENEKLKNGVVSNENGDGGKIKNKDEDRKRTTYKQDFVGFLANVNGLSRNLHPF